MTFEKGQRNEDLAVPGFVATTSLIGEDGPYIPPAATVLLGSSRLKWRLAVWRIVEVSGAQGTLAAFDKRTGEFGRTLARYPWGTHYANNVASP